MAEDYFEEYQTPLGVNDTRLIRVEPCKFHLGEFVSYEGVARIEKIEIVKYRREVGSTIRRNCDAPYYHVININTGIRNQEFNNTLDKDPIAELLYG